jgi:hypothetical protein
MGTSGAVLGAKFKTIIDAELDVRTAREVFDAMITAQLLGIEQISDHRDGCCGGGEGGKVSRSAIISYRHGRGRKGRWLDADP